MFSRAALQREKLKKYSANGMPGTDFKAIKRHAYLNDSRFNVDEKYGLLTKMEQAGMDIRPKIYAWCSIPCYHDS